MKFLSLSECLADLEAKAKAAMPIGQLKPHLVGRLRDDNDASTWAIGMTDKIQDYLLVAQPKNVIALITKIRHLVLIGESEIRSLSDEARNRLLLEIEVPE